MGLMLSSRGKTYYVKNKPKIIFQVQPHLLPEAYGLVCGNYGSQVKLSISYGRLVQILSQQITTCGNGE